jgi:hypothetical protein
MRSERQSGQQLSGDGETIPRRETKVNPADLDVDLAQGRIKPLMRLFKTGVNSVNTFEGWVLDGLESSRWYFEPNQNSGL